MSLSHKYKSSMPRNQNDHEMNPTLQLLKFQKRVLYYKTTHKNLPGVQVNKRECVHLVILQTKEWHGFVISEYSLSQCYLELQAAYSP